MKVRNYTLRGIDLYNRKRISIFAKPLSDAKYAYSDEFIGNLLEVHRNSVDHWLQSYKAKGMEGLTALHYKSRKSDLELYADRVKAHFSDGYIQTVKEFSHKLYELTGVSGGLTQVRHFIKKAGFKWLQSGHIPARADTEKQRQWKETVLDPAIEEASKGKCHLFFLRCGTFCTQTVYK